MIYSFTKLHHNTKVIQYLQSGQLDFHHLKLKLSTHPFLFWPIWIIHFGYLNPNQNLNKFFKLPHHSTKWLISRLIQPNPSSYQINFNLALNFLTLYLHLFHLTNLSNFLAVSLHLTTSKQHKSRLFRKKHFNSPISLAPKKLQTNRLSILLTLLLSLH